MTARERNPEIRGMKFGKLTWKEIAFCFKFFMGYRGYRTGVGVGGSTAIVKRPNVLAVTHLEDPQAKFYLSFAGRSSLAGMSLGVA